MSNAAGPLASPRPEGFEARDERVESGAGGKNDTGVGARGVDHGARERVDEPRRVDVHGAVRAVQRRRAVHRRSPARNARARDVRAIRWHWTPP